jgi:hypothetical protein
VVLMSSIEQPYERLLANKVYKTLTRDIKEGKKRELELSSSREM